MRQSIILFLVLTMVSSFAQSQTLGGLNVNRGGLDRLGGFGGPGRVGIDNCRLSECAGSTNIGRSTGASGTVDLNGTNRTTKKPNFKILNRSSYIKSPKCDSKGCSIKIKVRNIGGPVYKSFTVALQVGKKPKANTSLYGLSDGYHGPLQQTVPAGMASNKSLWLTFYISSRFADLRGAERKIYVCLDHLKNISESDEKNNCGVKTQEFQ